MLFRSNPFSAHAEARLDPLDAAGLKIEGATVAAADLQTFLAGLKPFRRARVTLGMGTVGVSFDQLGPDVTARVRLAASPTRRLTIIADQVWIGVLPVPAGLANWVIRHYDPAPKLASRVPFAVEVGPITVRPEAIAVSRPR